MDVLAQQRQRAGGPGSDAAHPVGHAVSDRDVEAAGVELGESGRFHRGEGDVAGRGGQQPDSDADPAGAGQHGCRLDQPSAVTEVFDDPQFAEAIGLCFLREGDDVGPVDVAGRRTPIVPDAACGLMSGLLGVVLGVVLWDWCWAACAGPPPPRQRCGRGCRRRER